MTKIFQEIEALHVGNESPHGEAHRAAESVTVALPLTESASVPSETGLQQSCSAAVTKFSPSHVTALIRQTAAGQTDTATSFSPEKLSKPSVPSRKRKGEKLVANPCYAPITASSSPDSSSDELSSDDGILVLSVTKRGDNAPTIVISDSDDENDEGGDATPRAKKSKLTELEKSFGRDYRSRPTRTSGGDQLRAHSKKRFYKESYASEDSCSSTSSVEIVTEQEAEEQEIRVEENFSLNVVGTSSCARQGSVKLCQRCASDPCWTASESTSYQCFGSPLFNLDPTLNLNADPDPGSKTCQNRDLCVQLPLNNLPELNKISVPSYLLDSKSIFDQDQSKFCLSKLVRKASGSGCGSGSQIKDENRLRIRDTACCD